MSDDEYGWGATLILAVAVCERLVLLADQEAAEPIRDEVTSHAGQLRELAVAELARLQTST